MANFISLVKSNFTYIFITIMSFVLRFINYSVPSKAFAMDEIYYIPDSYSIMKYGYEVDWIKSDIVSKGADAKMYHQMLTGIPESMNWGATHPPLGKMIMGLGMLIFGNMSPLGWRIGAIVVGTLVVVATMILAHLLFKKRLVTVLAGLTMAIDPMAIAMSRVSHLDIFLTLFVLIGFIFTARYVKTYKYRDMILLSVGFGLATAVKWSGVYAFAAVLIGLLVHHIVKKDFKKNFVKLVISPFVFLFSYLITWTSWIINYGLPKVHGNLYEAFHLLFQDHLNLMSALAKLDYSHPYRSKASEWIINSHTTLLYREFYDHENKVSAVFSTPNFAFWITGMVCFVALLLIVIVKPKQYLEKYWIPVLGVIAGWVPWMFFNNRTIFQFYAIVFEPYLYIILAVALVYAINKSKGSKINVGRMVILAGIVCSIFLYSSAVGLVTSSNNSGYAINSRWEQIATDFRFYDSSQYDAPASSKKSSISKSVNSSSKSLNPSISDMANVSSSKVK